MTERPNNPMDETEPEFSLDEIGFSPEELDDLLDPNELGFDLDSIEPLPPLDLSMQTAACLQAAHS